MFVRFLLTILILFLASSCFRLEGPQKSFKKELLNANKDFRDGWYDGCTTGSGAGGDTYYQSFTPNNKVDGWRFANSPDYKTAWSYAFWFCYRDDGTDQKSTPFKSFFGGFT